MGPAPQMATRSPTFGRTLSITRTATDVGSSKQPTRSGTSSGSLYTCDSCHTIVSAMPGRLYSCSDSQNCCCPFWQ